MTRPEHESRGTENRSHHQRDSLLRFWRFVFIRSIVLIRCIDSPVIIFIYCLQPKLYWINNLMYYKINIILDAVLLIFRFRCSKSNWRNIPSCKRVATAFYTLCEYISRTRDVVAIKSCFTRLMTTRDKVPT